MHHPYRTLLALQAPLHLQQDELSLAWSVVNDSYLTDLPLLCSLHVIAATAVFLALVLKPSSAGLQGMASTATALAGAVQAASEGVGQAPTTTQGKVQSLVKWLAESEIDLKAMVDCAQEIISLYEVWEAYNDKTCKEQITRFVKARNLDK